jgi:hypothetical protein
MGASYIESLAAQIRSHVPAELVPDDAGGLFLIYAALGLAKGERVEARDVHNAWAAWMAQRDPGHESIKPYGELPASVRAEDDPFVLAIREAARESAG